MMTEQQEANLAAAHGRAKKKKQDKANPMVINIHNGRLMPNTPRLRAHKDYRVYGGKLDASVPERMRWLEGALKQLPTKVVNSKEAEDMFDVGTASIDDLVVFAVEQWGATLDPNKPIKQLRKEVVALAEKHASDEAQH
jgi:hypothetical protein